MNETGETIQQNATPDGETKKDVGGRPTKADTDDRLVEKVDEYLANIDVIRKTHMILPTVEGLARFLKVDADTINNWAEKRIKDEKGQRTKKRVFPKFFGAVKRLKNLQKELLINDGLYGGRDVNSIMSIFLLKVNHNMIETTNVDHTTKGKEMPVAILGGASSVQSDNSNT